MIRLKRLFKHPVLTEVIPFLLVIGLDRFFKNQAVAQNLPSHFGPLKFDLYYNHGLMLGFMEHLPSALKIVPLTSLGAFIFCGLLFLRLMVPMHSMWLKTGLSLTVAGILGNVWDRMIGDGGVVDFITLANVTGTPIWNPADSFQLLGYFCVCFGIWSDAHHYWPAKDFRKTFWVMPIFQRKFCIQLLTIGFSVGMTSSVMSFAFLKTTLEISGTSPEFTHDYLKTFVISLAVLQACLSMVILVIGSYLSGKVAGPLFAIERYLRQSLTQKKGPFKLRTYDQLKEFEPLLSEVNEKLHASDKSDNKAA